MGMLDASQNSHQPKSGCSKFKELSQEDSKFANPVLHGANKSFFLHFKRYNLAIYVVNFFESFSTCYFNNKKQDPTVESQKYIYIYI
jgi:hypothetical protein